MWYSVLWVTFILVNYQEQNYRFIEQVYVCRVNLTLQEISVSHREGSVGRGV